MAPRKKITELTPQQRDRMASFAQEWIEYGWRTQPLTEEEWAVWEAGARKCYEFAGVPWPGVVIRTFPCACWWRTTPPVNATAPATPSD